VVRSVLVTALNLDIGRHMWGPSALGRRGDEPEPPAGAVAEGTRVPAPRRGSDATQDVRPGN
jgi:RND superfamily putative drug exporter